MGYLIQNAKILADASTFHTADVAISDEGIIESVGKVQASIRGPLARHSDPSSYERVNACGHVLLPGLVNAHTHAAMNLLRGVGDDLQLYEWLGSAIWPREKKMAPSDVETGTLLACAEMIRSGTTCFNDMYFHMESVARATRKSGLRAVLGYGMIDLGDFEGKGKKELKITEELVNKKADSEGKAHSTHSTSPLVTYSIAPHATHTCSTELLRQSAKLAKKLKLPLHIHAAETRKELADVMEKTKKENKIHALRPIDYLDSCGCLTSSTILAHGVYVTKSEVSLIAKRSSSLAHCPVSNLKLAGGGAAPIPEFLAAGANLALGTDGAASNNSLDLFQSMKVGAIEQKNFRFDASAVKAESYLSMATQGGAKALGMDGRGPSKLRAGRIAPGFLADLILVDYHSPNLVPFTSNAGWLVYSAGPQNVTDVMVNGQWLMREKKLLTLDEEKIMDEAQKAAEKLA